MWPFKSKEQKALELKQKFERLQTEAYTKYGVPELFQLFTSNQLKEKPVVFENDKFKIEIKSYSIFYFEQHTFFEISVKSSPNRLNNAEVFLAKAIPVLETFFNADISKENVQEVFAKLVNIGSNPELVKYLTRYATKKAGIYKPDYKNRLFSCGMELAGSQYLQGFSTIDR